MIDHDNKHKSALACVPNEPNLVSRKREDPGNEVAVSIERREKRSRRQKSRDKERHCLTSILGSIPTVLSKDPERVHQVSLRGTEKANFGE